ncbi:hypothetical protein REPUB_Repub17cG0012100 [Reevesia pubescens]
MLSDVESFGFGEAVGEECLKSVSKLQDICHEKNVNEDDKSGSTNIIEKHFSFTIDIVKSCFAEDHLLEFINMHPQKYVFDRVFPVELIDLSTSSNHFIDLGKQDNENETSYSPIEETVALHAIDESVENSSPREVESLELGAAHQQDKNDLNLLAGEPKPKTLLSTRDSELPQVQESIPSFQCLQEDSFSTFENEVKEVDAPESYDTDNFGKPLLFNWWRSYNFHYPILF